MRKKLIAILTLCIVLCTALFGLTACAETPSTHSHLYNKKVVSETYLKSSATCEKKAEYYYSCECGEVGSMTFESGDYAECVYINGQCKVCKTADPDYNDNTQDTPTHSHLYNKKVVSETYLKSSATCSKKAEYYYSCECGEVGNTTFEDGDFGEHDYGAFKNNGNGTHTKTCATHKEHTITEDCIFGTPTCTKKATCSGCGGEYGELAEHTYNTTYSTSETHHWFNSNCGCNLKKDYEEHTLGEDDCCEKCSLPLSSTEKASI